MPWVYWLTVVLVSVVGTQITDALTDRLDVSLYTSTIVFALALAATFAAWYASERTLSIHTITTRRRELFYWAAILFTFALGTAAGDLATEALGLGFTVGVLVFSAMIAATFLAYRLGGNAVLTFWIAYILTRPLGASLGDLLSQSRANGGLGLGTVGTSLVFLAVIVTLVTVVSIGRNEPGSREGPWATCRPARSTTLPRITSRQTERLHHEQAHPHCLPGRRARDGLGRRRRTSCRCRASTARPMQRPSWATCRPTAPSSWIRRRWWTRATWPAPRPGSRTWRCHGTRRRRP